MGGELKDERKIIEKYLSQEIQENQAKTEEYQTGMYLKTANNIVGFDREIKAEQERQKEQEIKAAEIEKRKTKKRQEKAQKEEEKRSDRCPDPDPDPADPDRCGRDRRNRCQSGHQGSQEQCCLLECPHQL